MNRKFIAGAIAFCILFLCGCGAKTQISAEDYAAEYAADYEADYYDAAGEYLESTSGAAVNGFSATTSINSDSADRSATGETGQLSTDKIVYTGDAVLETTDFDKTIQRLETMLKESGGYVESSSLSSSDYASLSRGTPDRKIANYTLRIPADKFTDVMNALPELGNVPESSTYADNISAEYYDTKARLENYQAQEKRLKELLEKATTVSDIIEIESQLTEVRYTIDSLQSRMNRYDQSVSYSTLTLQVREVREYTPQEEQGFFSRLAQAFKQGWESLGEFFLEFIELLPVLLFVIAIVLLLIWGIRELIGALRSRSLHRNGEKERRIKEQTEETELKENETPGEAGKEP